jgi:murein DD-endopeptidase MepM/ murein hydrolase activator NlpD
MIFLKSILNLISSGWSWVFAGSILWLAFQVSLIPPNYEANAPIRQEQDFREGQVLSPTPVFHYPVVTATEISSYFDHDPTLEAITFYNGRTNAETGGFLFTCPAFDDIAPGVGNSWVGCETAGTSEAACVDEKELWYDNHQGIDYEYEADWRTGNQCDLARFANPAIPIYAPAAGLVDFIGEEHPFNGNFIRLYHDLNEDGNYYNDGLRSYYLHFATNGIVVDEGDILQEGDLLGYGGNTGLAWTPHLHFEVQRRTEQGWHSVDPFGWIGSEPDPWLVPNHLLWDDEENTTND